MPCNEDEGDYYALPPSNRQMINDWLEWRTKINEGLIAVHDDKDKKMTGKQIDTDRELLTLPAEKKAPGFFKGHMSVHGKRILDEYGPAAITEADDDDTKMQKKMMDTNFFSFGIPRVTMSRCSSRSNSRRGSCASLTAQVDEFVNPDDELERPFQGLSLARRRQSMASNASNSLEIPDNVGPMARERASSAGKMSTRPLDAMQRMRNKFAQRHSPNSHNGRALPPIPVGDNMPTDEHIRRRSSTGNILFYR